jgi:hypothetical protein
MKKAISINTIREGILTMSDEVMTIITDQDIEVGDTLNSELHQKRDTRTPIDFIVNEVVEKRKSRGDWKTEPPTWYKIKYLRA